MFFKKMYYYFHVAYLVIKCWEITLCPPVFSGHATALGRVMNPNPDPNPSPSSNPNPSPNPSPSLTLTLILTLALSLTLA